MVRLSSDAFLDQLTRMIRDASNRREGTVDVVFKRYSVEGEAKLPPSCNSTGKTADAPAAKPDAATKKASQKGSKKGSQKDKKPVQMDHTKGTPSCLVRATLGSKKISCVVSAEDAVSFQQYYNSIYRAHTTALVRTGELSRRDAKRVADSEKGATKKPRSK
jgi:hypothetical protein